MKKVNMNLQSWAKAGFDSISNALAWAGLGLEPEEAGEWNELTFGAQGAKRWIERGFTLAEAKKWLKAGVGPITAIVLERKGVAPKQYKTTCELMR